MQDTLESVKNFLKSILFASGAIIKGLVTYTIFAVGACIYAILNSFWLFASLATIIFIPILNGRERED